MKELWDMVFGLFGQEMPKGVLDLQAFWQG